MFEIPNSKRVRREELISSPGSVSRSRSPSAETAAQLHSRLASYFGSFLPSEPVPPSQAQETIPRPFGETDAASSSSSASLSRSPSPATSVPESQLPSWFPILSNADIDPIHSPPRDDSEVHSFRLFSQQPLNARIHLATTTQGPGSILRPRPLTYYLIDPSKNATLAASAVSSSDIRRLAAQPWPGTAVPWRLSRVVVSKKSARRLLKAPPIAPTIPSQSASATPLISATDTTSKKTKPNKKRRLVLHQRARAAEAAAAQAAKDAQEAAARAAKEAQDAQARAAKQAQDKDLQAATAAQSAEEKAAADRLKRAARNRVKRAKRVAKEKARKAGAQVEAEARAEGAVGGTEV